MTGSVWASSLTIAAVMTLAIWVIWNFDMVSQTSRRKYQGAIEKQKRQAEDDVPHYEHAHELMDIQQRLQRLENSMTKHDVNEGYSESDAELMTAVEALQIKTHFNQQ